MCHGIGPYFFFAGLAAGFLAVAFAAGFLAAAALAAGFLAGAAFFSGAAFFAAGFFAGFASAFASSASGFLASTFFGSGRATLVCDGFLPSVRILAMPLLAAVVLAPLLLEHDDLVAARLLHHLGGNQRAGNGRAARLRAIAAKQQHLAERNDVAGLARDALDLDNVVRRHAILLAARADDREHVSLSSLTLGLESRPCLGRLGRGPEKMAGSEAEGADPAKRRTI